jgi:Nif-specific regulatory protein
MSNVALKTVETTTSSSTSELRRLSSFLEISQTLAAATNQKSAMHQVLGILEKHHGAVRSTIALLNPSEAQIDVVASEGPTAGKADTKFRLGEGITGRVIQSG